MDSDDFFAAEEQYGEDSAKTAAEAILNDDYEQLRDDDLKEGFLYVTKHVAAVKKEMIERGLLVKPEKGVAYQFPKRPSRQLSQLQQSRKRNDIRKKADKVMLAAMDSGALGFVYGIIYPDAVTEGKLLVVQEAMKSRLFELCCKQGV